MKTEYREVDLIIASLRFNFEIFRTKITIMQELDLNKNSNYFRKTE